LSIIFVLLVMKQAKSAMALGAICDGHLGVRRLGVVSLWRTFTGTGAHGFVV
jgi:hypothetical protein